MVLTEADSGRNVEREEIVINRVNVREELLNLIHGLAFVAASQLFESVVRHCIRKKYMVLFKSGMSEHLGKFYEVPLLTKAGSKKWAGTGTIIYIHSTAMIL